MNIAVINSGSSSIKFQLFCMEKKEVLAYILVEQIGEFSSHTMLKYADKKLEITSVLKNHHDGLEEIIFLLSKYEILQDFTSLSAIGHRVVHGGEEFKNATVINAIGHRVVHGGEEFKNATVINESVIKQIEALIPLAPLHNPANLEGILVARKKAPFVPQIAVFDTAFHSHMPEEAYLYALPYKMYEKYKIRRYGFHGTSHSYVLKKTAEFLKEDAGDLNIITLHLGNGSSVCAIEEGVSVDTSMGFTPLEGLIMGSRCGDIDPAILIHMQRELGMSVDEVDTLLNKKSGLIGICGSNDVRSLIELNDEKSKLAIKMMVRRIKKYIGAYIALLGEVDAIVFTGGIGENSAYIREMIFETEICGTVLDKDLNNKNETVISTKKSSIKLMVIKTNEEEEIANECLSVLKLKV
ncbi:MAG: acetate kinase [Campylobacterales bacterium]|nr:acetate kinase [Campylobacterales bacterium]